MKQLSEQQIKRALEVIEDEYNNRQIIEKLAPLVQFPWEPITEGEWSSHWKNGRSSREDANEVIAARNAALLPPPVDPRREKILAAILRVAPDHPHFTEKILNSVLAVLDNTQSR